MTKKKAKQAPAPQSGGGTAPLSMTGSMKRYVKGFFLGDKPVAIKIVVVIVVFMALVAALYAFMGKV